MILPECPLKEKKCQSLYLAYDLKIAMSDTVLAPELFSNLLSRLM